MVSGLNRKLVLGAGVSLMAMSIAAPVWAQDASPAPQGAAPAVKSDDTLVVVTARRKALQNATERKKNSDTVIDSVVADEAGKLPDSSITEVLLESAKQMSPVRRGLVHRAPGVTAVRQWLPRQKKRPASPGAS